MACQNPFCYKNRAALAQAANQTKENFAAVTTRTSYAPRVVTGPENAVSQMERLHSEAAPGLGGHVCVVLVTTMEMGVNRQFLFSCFQ